MIKTISLETAKLLKEAGFRQDKISWYFVDMGDKRQKDYAGYSQSWVLVDWDCANARRNNTKNDKWPDEQISAPTTDELLECMTNNQILDYHNDFNESTGELMNIFRDTNELAKCWLWLKKENLIS